MMNARYIALLVLVGAAAVAAVDDANCNVPGFFESYCQHGGVCRDNGLTYADPSTCLCPTPSIGTACSFMVRECRDSPCINGGSCRNQPGGGTCNANNNYDCFRCACPPGWGYPQGWPWTSTNIGGICDTPRPVVGCDAFPCQNGGICSAASAPTLYTCNCAGTGYTGQNCTFNCTLGGVCQNGGTCHQGNCLCTSTYAGVDCSVPKFCTNSPCQNGATCTNTGSLGAGTCTCTSGWSGTYCSVPSFCSSNPCTAGGTCRDDLSDPAGGQGACQCPSGYNSGWLPSHNFVDRGIKNCSTLNFCGASPCQNSATCVQNTNNNDGSCSCRDGFAGKYCEVNLANIKGCYNKVNGKQCFDHGSCGCTDQASCDGNDWNVRCHCQGASLSNTGLGYADCRCNSTYVPRCPTVTAVAVNDFPCQNGGSCIEHANGWGCECRTGYYGSRCESYHNPCGSSPCQNNGQCSIITETSGYANQLKDTYWTYRCQCKYPYYGRECQNKIEDPANVCVNTVPTPVCQNGGSCVPRPYNFNYNAAPVGGGGFFIARRVGGRSIGTNDNIGGKVVRKELAPWMCKCPAGYYGDNCEYSSPYDPQTLLCGVNWPPITTPAGAYTCANGGTCINDATLFQQPKCACRCGFSGEYCEVIANGLDSAVAETYIDNYGVKMDFCKTNICQNGGSCVTSSDWQDAYCLCAPGFFGYYCQYQGLAAGANVLPSAIVVAAAAVVAAALRM